VDFLVNDLIGVYAARNRDPLKVWNCEKEGVPEFVGGLATADLILRRLLL
jgi:hypothetical protein